MCRKCALVWPGSRTAGSHQKGGEGRHGVQRWPTQTSPHASSTCRRKLSAGTYVLLFDAIDHSFIDVDVTRGGRFDKRGVLQWRDLQGWIVLQVHHEQRFGIDTSRSAETFRVEVHTFPALLSVNRFAALTAWLRANGHVVNSAAAMRRVGMLTPDVASFDAQCQEEHRKRQEAEQKLQVLEREREQDRQEAERKRWLLVRHIRGDPALTEMEQTEIASMLLWPTAVVTHMWVPKPQ